MIRDMSEQLKSEVKHYVTFMMKLQLDTDCADVMTKHTHKKNHTNGSHYNVINVIH